MTIRVMLIGEDDTLKREMGAQLEKDQVGVVSISNFQEAQTAVSSGAELGVAAVEVSQANGKSWEILTSIKNHNPRLKWIAISTQKEKDLVVKALKQGASNYFETPLNTSECLEAIKHCIHEYEADHYRKDLLIESQMRVQRAEGKLEDRFCFVSKAKSMEPVNELLTALRRDSLKGAAEPSVLITGESGSGREGIARMIHVASRRAKRPWVVMNCNLFPGEDQESELFGHEKGAFHEAHVTKKGLLEIANGGTLFLEEFSALTSATQAKLVRFLHQGSFRRMGGTHDHTVDVRLIAGAGEELKTRVHQGKFREDLAQRIGQIALNVAPLRERVEDILPLATQFARELFRQKNKEFEGFQESAEKTLMDYAWPGNVHELHAVIERVALSWNGEGKVSLNDVATAPSSSPVQQPHLRLVTNSSPSMGSVGEDSGSYTVLKKKWCNSFEKDYLKGALSRNEGNVSAAAREAKLDRSNFLRLLRKHGLKAEDFRKRTQLHQEAA